MNYTQNPKYILFKFSLLLLLLQSIFAWFLWETFIFTIIFAFMATFIFYFTSKGCFSFNRSNVIPIVLLVIVQLYVVKGMNTNALIAALLRIIIFSAVLLLNDRIKIDLFHFFTKAFAILLSVSLFGWILFLLGVPLPNNPTDFNNGLYYFNNYYFFLLEISSIGVLIPRYSSVFLEPSYLGMIASFLFIANRFELKRKAVLIIFIAILFTFSLAAYIVLLISASGYIILCSKKPIRNFMIFGLFLFSIYFYFSNLNNGDNLVNNLIFERLKYENGDLAGNNRFSPDLDVYLQQSMKTNDKYWGIGAAKFRQMTWEGGNAGYKVYLLQYGIVGTLLVFLFYISMFLSNKSKLAWILLIAYVLIFLQAAYPLMECQLLIFITAIPTLKSIINK